MLVDSLSSYSRGIERCFAEIEVDKLEQAAELLLEMNKRGGTLFIIGNGGSAATASHMAIDLEKFSGLRVFSLTNVPNITAWGNDVGFESVFVEQLKRQLHVKDVLLAISASGNSKNVLNAVDYARRLGVKTVAFIGFGGGKLKDAVDVAVTVSSLDYGVVEDFHSSLNHILSRHLKTMTGQVYGTVDCLTYTFMPGCGGTQPYMNGNIHPAVFVDRDGVINKKITGHVTTWEQFEFVDGVREMLSEFTELKLPIIVISNQSCVGEDLLQPVVLQRITHKFVSLLRDAGAQITAVYYCPHTAEDDCSCRKPRTGLLERAALDWNIDLHRSVFIGDSATDIEVALAVDCHPILFGSNLNASEVTKVVRKTLGFRE